MRPPNSDLNPVDYAIWSVIQLNVVGNILTVHYKDMNCDVSFSLDSVSTLFRWGRHFLSYMCKMFPPVYNGANIIQIDQIELWSQMYCHLFMVHSVYTGSHNANACHNYYIIRHALLKAELREAVAGKPIEARSWLVDSCDISVQLISIYCLSSCCLQNAVCRQCNRPL